TSPLSPSANPDIPSATPGSGRSDLTPSSAGLSSYSLLPSVVAIVFGFAVFKHC
ncbi:non-specific lipid-transfer protein, partial [Trifolium medium]|nr:non-specific lipid-transfer protein [Trifolium medium]